MAAQCPLPVRYVCPWEGCGLICTGKKDVLIAHFASREGSHHASGRTVDSCRLTQVVTNDKVLPFSCETISNYLVENPELLSEIHQVVKDNLPPKCDQQEQLAIWVQAFLMCVCGNDEHPRMHSVQLISNQVRVLLEGREALPSAPNNAALVRIANTVVEILLETDRKLPKEEEHEERLVHRTAKKVVTGYETQYEDVDNTAWAFSWRHARWTAGGMVGPEPKLGEKRERQVPVTEWVEEEQESVRVNKIVTHHKDLEGVATLKKKGKRKWETVVAQRVKNALRDSSNPAKRQSWYRFEAIEVVPRDVEQEEREYNAKHGGHPTIPFGWVDSEEEDDTEVASSSGKDTEPASEGWPSDFESDE